MGYISTHLEEVSLCVHGCARVGGTKVNIVCLRQLPHLISGTVSVPELVAL